MDITLQEIRNNIDKLDFEVLELLKKRQDFVLSAAQFKDCEEGETGVIVPSRIKSMLEKRKQKAKTLELDTGFVDRLCKLVIDHMIELEMKKWNQNDCTN